VSTAPKGSVLALLAINQAEHIGVAGEHPAPAHSGAIAMLTVRQSAFDRTAFDRIAFDRLESDLFKRLEQQLHTAERVPAAEVRETEAGYSICLELPGVVRDSIDVKATDRNLVISAERRAPQAESTDGEPQATGAATLLSEIRYGTWSRSFRFPSGINREAVQAVYRDGLLSVEVPKAQTLTSVNVKVEG
jgi:HSP20 family protein